MLDIIEANTRETKQENPEQGSIESGLQNALKENCLAKCLDETQGFAPSDRVNRSNGERVELKDVPGAEISAEGNQYVLHYRALHLPTWNSKNPDGSAAKPFIDANGKERLNGKLEDATDSKGNTLGTDGKALYDPHGLRRYDQSGAVVLKQFEASDPDQMRAQLAKDGSPLSAGSRAAYNKVIESADKLDRVAMVKAMEENEKFVMSHTTAFLFETAYEQTQKQAAKLEEDITKAKADAAPQEVLDKLISERNQKLSEIKAKDEELLAKPDLLANVKRVREGAASDIEFGRLLISSVEARGAYIGKLLAETSVQKYMAEQDKNSDSAKQLEKDANVQEAKRIILEMAKLNPGQTNNLEPLAQKLGVNDFKARILNR